MTAVGTVKTARQPWIDRIRWVTVLLVVFYHVLYQFNSVGVIRNIDAPGIPLLDAPLYFLYPWFMCLLFLVAGISARYSLEKRTGKAFLKDRARRLLLPSIAGIFVLGWTSGWVTSHMAEYFVPDGLPGIVNYLIWCLSGIGPLWFAQELFAGCLVLLLLRAIDRNDRLWQLGGKVGLGTLIVLGFAVWGSSYLLITPMVEVYRNGIYWFMFLMGYYIFSHEEIIDRLAKVHVPLLIAGCLLGVTYTVYYFGQNYTTRTCLQSAFTNGYAWVMILALLGTFKARWTRTSPLSDYLTRNNFAIFALHNPLLVLIAYFVTAYLAVPVWADYLLTFLGTAVLLLPFCELVHRIPIIRTLLLGE